MWAQEEAGVLRAPTLFLSCSILRYRLPLIVRVIMMSLFQKPGARQGNGERERRRAPGYWLYSYSTYVLRSIHKRCSTVFLVAGRVQAAAKKAHSRKLKPLIPRCSF